MNKALEKELEGIFLTILDPTTREAGFRRLEAKFGDGDEGAVEAAPTRGDNVIAFPGRRKTPQVVVEAEVVVKPSKPKKKSRRKSGKGVLKFIEENAEPLRLLVSLLGEVGKSAIELYARTKTTRAPRPRRPRLPAPKS